MTTLLEAAKKALEALEKAAEWSDYGKDDSEYGFRHCCFTADWKPHSNHCRLLPIITALRAAIEAAEKQEPCSKCKGLGIVPIGDGYSVDPCPKCTHSAPTIPEGWQLVPKEPTHEMLCSAKNAIGWPSRIGTGDANVYYKAMIAAAPQPKVTP